jgi:hypothetical protein
MSTILENRRFTLTRPLCSQCAKLQEEVKRLRENTIQMVLYNGLRGTMDQEILRMNQQLLLLITPGMKNRNNITA